MNAEELIEQVKDIVDDPSYEDHDFILSLLNQSQNTLATNLFLPDLKDGYDTVSTVLGTKTIPMPDEYHKGLFMAVSAGKELDIHQTVKDFSLINGGLTIEEGDLTGVTVNRSSLVYQMVPAVVTDIELFFYRKPVDMTESTSSFPDGAVGNDDFEWAIVHLAASKIFNRIEDGMEGAKVNTAAQEAMFRDRAAALDIYADFDGKEFSTRPSTNLSWLGVK